MRSPTAITTYSGIDFDVLAPRAEDIRLVDVVHALSHLCRFTGHVRIFWSVAAHVMLVADLVRDQLDGSPQAQLAALLHETSETYLCDLPTPLKYGTTIGQTYREIEERLMNAAATAFRLPTDFHRDPIVKRADEMAVIIEAIHLLSNPTWAIERAAVSGIADLIAPQAHRFRRDATPAHTRSLLKQRILTTATEAGHDLLRLAGAA
jgi:uncharacterized protein